MRTDRILFIQWGTVCGVIPLLLAGLFGCVGYQLGSMLPPDIRTVHIPTFINETEEPLLEIATTRAAISEMQRDGSLRIASADEADALLTVRLTDFRLQPLAYDRNRRAAAEEYRMFITASIVMTRHATQEIIVEADRITGDATFLLVGDMTSSRQSGLPDTARDLAQQIISRLVETW